MSRQRRRQSRVFGRSPAFRLPGPPRMTTRPPASRWVFSDRPHFRVRFAFLKSGIKKWICSIEPDGGRALLYGWTQIRPSLTRRALYQTIADNHERRGVLRRSAAARGSSWNGNFTVIEGPHMSCNRSLPLRSRKRYSSLLNRRHLMEVLEPRQLLATVQWINPASGSWDVATNGAPTRSRARVTTWSSRLGDHPTVTIGSSPSRP